MPILIDFYLTSRKLKRPFKTARSEVSEKDVLILVFDNEFAFELPLSPSMGEMPSETIDQAKKNQISMMTQRALSFYQGMTASDFKRPEVMPQKTFHTITYDINSTEIEEGSYLQRFKGSSENMSEIIDWSQNHKDTWTVDFNAGLNEEELRTFLKEADLENCQFIEQPMPAGDLTLPKSPVPYWVDEGLKELAPNRFLESAYKGFMLKPLAFDFPRFLEWMNFAKENQIPFFISGLACDNLFFSFLRYWNKCSTWRNIYPERAGFFINDLEININPYETGNFSEVIEKIRADFEKVCSLEV